MHDFRHRLHSANLRGTALDLEPSIARRLTDIQMKSFDLISIYDISFYILFICIISLFI